jgi:hypothetical protein
MKETRDPLITAFSLRDIPSKMSDAMWASYEPWGANRSKGAKKKTPTQKTRKNKRSKTVSNGLPKYLKNQLEILLCHYNFLRPQRFLKFGNEKRTPAIQARLSNQLYSFREVFTFRFILKIHWEIKRKMESELQSLPRAA